MVRLFQDPLVVEVSWLLPLVLLAVPVILTALTWTWPLDAKTISLLLWAGWLLPSMAYFSFTAGLFHRYYLIMLGPPIAALVGIFFWALIKHWKRNHWLGWGVLVFISGLTVTFQAYTFRNDAAISGAVGAAALGCWGLGMGLLALRSRRALQTVGAVLVLFSMLVVPASLSGLAATNPNPDVALPTAGAGAMSKTTFMTPNQGSLDSNGQAILDYLLDNTDPDSYLLATNNARGAAPFILAVGRPVLTFGGFTGNDAVIDLNGFVEMLENDRLRFVLGVPQKPEIAQWMRRNCQVVEVPGLRGQTEPLFDCSNGG
jgi:4-amino-4-deoxy-L-arabinose transferase-like glycosyltransferase